MQATVRGVAKNRTRLSDFTFTFHFHAVEKEIATHSSVLVWRIPGTGEPRGLPSMGSQTVRHDWAISLLLSLSTPIIKIWKNEQLNIENMNVMGCIHLAI